MAKKTFPKADAAQLLQLNNHQSTGQRENPATFEPKRTRAKVSVRGKRPHQLNSRIDDYLRNRIDEIRFVNKIDAQDLVFAALNHFIQQYSEQGSSTNGLTEEGLAIVRSYIE